VRFDSILKRSKLIDKTRPNAIIAKKMLGGKSKNGTTHLWGHKQICIQYKISMRGSTRQTFLVPKVIHGKQELGTKTYDADNARTKLANAIIMHGYLLSIMDHWF